MARQKLKITYSDGRAIEAKVTPRVEVEVEKHFNIGLAALQSDMHAEYLYYMGWAAVHFSGQEKLQFDDFMKELEDVDLVPQTKEDDTDPFGKTPASANSSS